MTQSTVILHDFKKEANPMNKQEPSSHITIEEIMALIPHRYPMLLIDRVEDMQPGEYAVGVKNVSLNEWYFQGLFSRKTYFAWRIDCGGYGSDRCGCRDEGFGRKREDCLFYVY